MTHSIRANVAEDDKMYHIDLEMPGMTNIEVSQDEDILGIEAEKEQIEYIRAESPRGRFARFFKLPRDSGDITAKYVDGILQVQIEKDNSKGKKLIKVS